MKVAVRDRIVQAVAQILGEHGYARLTTKEIARAAGVAEGSIYYHFADKQDLVTALIDQRLPALLEVTRPLAVMAGRRTVAAVLTDVAQGLIEFYYAIQPLLGTLQADREVLDRLRRRLADRGQGPQRGVDAVAEYLAAEQAVGRVRADIDGRVTASLFVGACHQAAFTAWLVGGEPDPPARAIALYIATSVQP